MIKTNENQFSIGLICRRMASVSRSGYYHWKHRPVLDRNQANQLLTKDIKGISVAYLLR
jgi:hypothetical protein